MVAQSMIPGIFNPLTTVYTYADFEKEGTFKKLIDEAGEILCIPSHEVLTKENKKAKISCSTSTKVCWIVFFFFKKKTYELIFCILFFLKKRVL